MIRKAGVFMCCVLFSSSVLAGEIAATVNDTPISNFDVEARLKLTTLQQPDQIKNMSDAQLRRRVLDMLIEEEIKKQAAQKQGLSVSSQDIQEAVAHLEKQNRMTSGSLKKRLKDQKIPVETLHAQITSDLLWLQILQKHHTADYSLSDEVLKAKQDQIRQTLSKPAAIVSEIVVPDEKTADTVYEGLKDSQFEDLARLYSISKTKDDGGFVGEISVDHYGKKVWSIIDKVNVGTFSTPIKTDRGWLIVAVHDKKGPLTKDTVDIWDIVQMVVPGVPHDPIVPVSESIKDCRSFEEKAKEHAIQGSFQRGMVSPQQMPAPLREVLVAASVNELVGPVSKDDVSFYFMKCDETQRRLVPTTDELKEQSRLEQMELLSDKLLTGYKRLAVITYH